MFRDAMLLDLKPCEFWDMTVREYYIYSECFYEKRKEQMDYDMSLAWYNAYFQRVDKMPSLSEVLQKDESQDEEEMFETIKRINAMRGGQVIDGC